MGINPQDVNFLVRIPILLSTGEKNPKHVVCGLQFFSHRFDCLHVLDP